MPRLLVLIACGFMSTRVLGLPLPERVSFPSLAPADERSVTIDALLYRPSGAVPERGRSAVIALHGCAGLYSMEKGGDSRLTERHAARTEALLAAGYVVLLPDSLGSRGLVEICTVKAGERTLRAAHRRHDALGALSWLAAQPGIARDRIALLGWSHGGSTTLAAINAEDKAVRSIRERDAEPVFFRAAVAYYPGCSVAARDPRWRPAVPTLILIGAADDWTPAAPCATLASGAPERGWSLETRVYPGAYHGFDAPSGRVRLRSDVPNGVSPGKGVHVGPDAAARDDANRRVDEFLRVRLAR
jgi:dienelactone hydrolase